MTLDVKAWLTILHVKDVLPYNILLLEDKVQGCPGMSKHLKNCAWGHLPLTTLFIQSWPLCRRILPALNAVRRKEQPLCCCGIVDKVMAYDLLDATSFHLTIWKLDMCCLLEVFEITFHLIKTIWASNGLITCVMHYHSVKGSRFVSCVRQHGDWPWDLATKLLKVINNWAHICTSTTLF